MIYLTLPELVYVAERTLGTDFIVRDYGLPELVSNTNWPGSATK